MKRKFKKSLVSLTLCATLGCAVGAFASLSYFDTQADAPLYYTLQGFEINEEASVRSMDPNGIRFTTVLDEETKSEIASLGLSNVTYGALLLPADFLGTEELTHSTAKVLNIPSTQWQDDAQTTYTSVLVGKDNGDGTYQNLSESYYNRPIAARSYVTGEKDGKKVTYYSENTAVRSIGYVAYMAQLEGHNSQLLSDIVSKTNVELVFNGTQISALQAENDGLTVVENKVEQSTSNAVSLMVGGIAVPSSVLGNVVYTSSASDIISVNGQTLTAEMVGSATITASVTINGKTYTAEKVMSTDSYKAETEYKILISEDAAAAQLNSSTSYLPVKSEEEYIAYYTAFEKTAAYKLQKILKEATGVELPIVTTIEPGVKYISVGETVLANGINMEGIGDTEAKVEIIDGNVIIIGGSQEGTLYGVQRWLGDVAGYEYYIELI